MRDARRGREDPQREKGIEMGNPGEAFYYLDVEEVDMGIERAIDLLTEGMSAIMAGWGEMPEDDIRDLISRVQGMVHDVKYALTDAKLGEGVNVIQDAQSYVEENRDLETFIEEVITEAEGREMTDPVEEVWGWAKAVLLGRAGLRTRWLTELMTTPRRY